MSEPLSGRTVLVTRPLQQTSRLSEALRAAGDTLGDPDHRHRAPGELGGCGRSHRAGRLRLGGVYQRQRRNGLPGAAGAGSGWTGLVARDPGGPVGPRTAELLRQADVRVDVVPDEFVADALVATLAHDEPLDGRRVLFPGADRARDTVDRGLRQHGGIVDRVTVYRTVPAPVPPALRSHLEHHAIDVATFTSASTVTSLLDMLGTSADLLAGVVVACIGPVTADAARARGLTVDVVAEQHTIPGLVEALSEFYRARVTA